MTGRKGCIISVLIFVRHKILEIQIRYEIRRFVHHLRIIGTKCFFDSKSPSIQCMVLVCRLFPFLVFSWSVGRGNLYI